MAHLQCPVLKFKVLVLKYRLGARLRACRSTDELWNAKGKVPLAVEKANSVHADGFGDLR